jgi:methylenetetrahydrofolate dehydrogenase (NADP+)/methenyltetrahydrofolate cyclohydrolase
MTKIIDGKALAEKIRKKLKEKIATSKIRPGLAVILVGHDEPSHLYVKLKEKACHEVGIYFEKYLFFYNTLEKEIIEKIQSLNKNLNIHGIVVQLPLPKHLDEDRIIEQIDWRKDVDGFHPYNIKNLLAGSKVIEPSLIKSILELIKATRMSLKEKKTAILANSDILIQPLKYLLEKKKAQVVVRKAGDYFQDATQEADLIITAYGRPRFLKAGMIKEEAVLIDVGINRTENGQTVGDVDFEDVKDKANFISPVPGGVGPLTVAFLLENTYLASQTYKF